MVVLRKEATKAKALAILQGAIIKLKDRMDPPLNATAILADMDPLRRTITAVSQSNVLSPCLSSFTDFIGNP